MDRSDLLDRLIALLRDRGVRLRQKNLADIARLIEAEPALRVHVPQDVLGRLV